MNNIISRKQARSLGLTRYFTGKPCVHGHVCQRKMDGSCVDCRVIQSREMKDWNAKYNATPERLAARAAWNSKRYGCDVLFKIAATQRRRLNLALKRGQKSGSAVRDLGCSILELKEYLENHSSWESNSTWGNWGTVWELDHVKALALFDLGNRDQLLQAVHFTNLQPLSVEKHRIKTSVDMDLIRGSKKETPVLGR